jgi:hypothetical protein
MTRRYRSNHIYSATGTARQVRQSPHPSLVSQSVGVGAATLTLRRFAHVRLKAAQIAPGHQMTLRPRECRDQPAMNTFEWRRPAHQPLSLPLPPSPRCPCGHPPLENLQPKLGTSNYRSYRLIWCEDNTMSACGRVALPPSLLPVAALLTMPLVSAALLAVGTDDARSVAESSAAGRTTAVSAGTGTGTAVYMVDVHNTTTCASGGAMDCSVLGYRSEWRVHTACSYVKSETSYARLPVPAPHYAPLRHARLKGSGAPIPFQTNSGAQRQTRFVFRFCLFFSVTN